MMVVFQHPPARIVGKRAMTECDKPDCYVLATFGCKTCYLAYIARVFGMMGDQLCVCPGRVAACLFGVIKTGPSKDP